MTRSSPSSRGSAIGRLRAARAGAWVALTLLLDAGLFGGLVGYGTTTEQVLGGLGQLLFMGVLGVVLASIVGIFWHSDALQFVLSLIGALVFSGLAAYD